MPSLVTNSKIWGEMFGTKEMHNIFSDEATIEYHYGDNFYSKMITFLVRFHGHFRGRMQLQQHQRPKVSGGGKKTKRRKSKRKTRKKHKRTLKKPKKFKKKKKQSKNKSK